MIMNKVDKKLRTSRSVPSIAPSSNAKMLVYLVAKIVLDGLK